MLLSHYGNLNELKTRVMEKMSVGGAIPIHDQVPIIEADPGPHVPDLGLCGLSVGSKHVADAAKRSKENVCKQTK